MLSFIIGKKNYNLEQCSCVVKMYIVILVSVLEYLKYFLQCVWNWCIFCRDHKARQVNLGRTSWKIALSRQFVFRTSALEDPSDQYRNTPTLHSSHHFPAHLDLKGKIHVQIFYREVLWLNQFLRVKSNKARSRSQNLSIRAWNILVLIW